MIKSVPQIDAVSSSQSEAIVSSNFSIQWPGEKKEYKVELDSDTFQPIIPQKIVYELSCNAADFIEGSRSFLSFNLFNNRETDPNYSFGGGSAINWIKSIQVISSDGQTIDLCDNVNVYKAISDRWTKPDFYFNSGLGAGVGYNTPDNKASSGRYTIYLNEIIPLFSSTEFLPPNVINKMRIIITLAPAHEVLKYDNITAPVDVDNIFYRVEFPVIFLATHRMDAKFLNDYTRSTQIIEFDSYKSQQEYYDKSSIRHLLTYSLAKAKRAFAISGQASNETDPEAREQELLRIGIGYSDVWRVKGYQFRVGNLMIPQQPAGFSLDAYTLALDAFGNRMPIEVSPAEFEGNRGIYTVDLSRGGGGTPLYNNNQLILELKHKEEVSNPRTLHMFCEYTKRLELNAISEEERQRGYSNKLSILE